MPQKCSNPFTSTPCFAIKDGGPTQKHDTVRARSGERCLQRQSIFLSFKPSTPERFYSGSMEHARNESLILLHKIVVPSTTQWTDEDGPLGHSSNVSVVLTQAVRRDSLPEIQNKRP